ncbi:hypothetical protein POTOM_062130 [Populus tomentosa]|uniref:Pentatricopeptide repeat-containing protein n=1 Tax=Populus tomentosa TaxID=118781 RepID=A0A8X7XLJ5_POPTO|nr:hypothetical protein POTOM_062130 [Populus tomentosa]
MFYGSRERNPICWTALMSSYVSNGRLEQALRSVFVQSLTLKHGKEIHAFVVKHLFLPNASLTTFLITMYLKCGVFYYSIKLFDGVGERNVIAWIAMIDSYVENGLIDEAFNVFRFIQWSKHRPDSATMARMLNNCSEIKALKLGKEIHRHILKKDFESIPFVSTELVKMYRRCALGRRAKPVFNAVPAKGSMTWTAIIEAYGYNNPWKEAIKLQTISLSKQFYLSLITPDLQMMLV